MRRAILAHLESGQVTRVVYGSIIGLALVVSLEGHPPETGHVVAALLGTAVAVALAEVYSDTIGERIRRRDDVRGPHLAAIVEDGLAVAFGIAFPAVFFVLAAAGAMELDTAFTVAKWTGFALVGFYGYAAGRLAGAGLGRSLVQGLAVGLIGGALILLKALVH